MVFLGIEICGDKKIFLKKVCLNFFFGKKMYLCKEFFTILFIQEYYFLKPNL